MTQDLIPIEYIEMLSIEEFYAALTRNRLNNLSISASEYFERKEVIEAQIQRHAIENSDNILQYVRQVPNIQEDESLARHLLAVQFSEGDKLEFVMCVSETEKTNTLKRYKGTGIFTAFDSVTNKYVETKPNIMLDVDIKAVIRKKGYTKAYYDKDGTRLYSLEKVNTLFNELDNELDDDGSPKYMFQVEANAK